MTRLSTATDWILMPVMPNLNEEEFFTYMYQQRQLGYDANRYLRPRLLDLCDPRVFIVSYLDQFTSPVWGRTYVVQILNKYWGLNLNEGNVVEYLNTTGL